VRAPGCHRVRDSLSRLDRGIYFECRSVCLPRRSRPVYRPIFAYRSYPRATAPPDGKGWLHEIKHDGHRLVAIVPGYGQLRLLSRNGHDRSAAFREPFRRLVDAGLPPVVLDGEIAVPDDRGVTHLDWLSEATTERRPERLAYFAFDLLHLDGHDLRRCPIEDRKMLLRDVLGVARCERIVYVDHVRGIGGELFEAVQQIGAEGIVSKRCGSLYRGGESRDWLKTKCH
jgi:bifunctional non-homologous end joining protein LigD